MVGGPSMIRSLRIALGALIAIVSLSGSTAMAGAYYDQASWLADMQGLSIKSYTGGYTETIYTATISTGGIPACVNPASGFCILSLDTTTTHSTGLGSISL